MPIDRFMHTLFCFNRIYTRLKVFHDCSLTFAWYVWFVLYSGWVFRCCCSSRVDVCYRSFNHFHRLLIVDFKSKNAGKFMTDHIVQRQYDRIMDLFHSFDSNSSSWKARKWYLNLTNLYAMGYDFGICTCV